MGVQLFKGLFEYRCRFTPEPVNGEWPADPSYTRLCQVGTCPNGLYCGSPADYNMDPIDSEIEI